MQGRKINEDGSWKSRWASSSTFTTTPFRCVTTKPYRIWQTVSKNTAYYLPLLRDRSQMAADMK